jgi:AraC-like DNA-binding protein
LIIDCFFSKLFQHVLRSRQTCLQQYGWREYDFKKGLINFFAPSQIHLWSEKTEFSDTWGWLLTFHPDYIRKYPLGTNINRLKFFSYETNEALHISEAERLQIDGIMQNIQNEDKRSIDEYSQEIIVSQLDVLLNYAKRFYTRQFRTRHSVETDIITRFENILHSHFAKDNHKLISANEIAAELAMSTNYLSDLLRSLTGMNIQQHIHIHLIEKAKNLLLTTNLSINEIAFSLGFEYPQYFNRLFKNKTGKTPVEFRNVS